VRKLGLIGGTGPESTVIYYREVISGVQKRLGKKTIPRITVESLSVFDVLRFCECRDYGGLTKYLARGVNNLARAGAELAAFTGITPHIVFEEVAKLSPIPIVSMVDATRIHAKARGYRKIAILGTMPTMGGDFFKKPFKDAGIEVVTPNGEEMTFIEGKIEDELEHGIVEQGTRMAFEEISLRLIGEDGVDAIVLGCTELPLLFDGISLPVDKIDAMRTHINALISAII